MQNVVLTFRKEETWQASKGKQRETQRICTDFGEKNRCLGISKQSPERTNKEADAVVRTRFIKFNFI